MVCPLISCADRSADCALLASSGQCASSPTARALCPQSCGIGCGASPNYLYPLSYGGGAPSGSLSSPSPFLRSHPPSASPLRTFTSAELDQNQYGQGFYGQSLRPNYGQNYEFGQAAGAYSGANGEYNGNGGVPFACRDSHIYGCPAWASQGLCQQIPEYMLNYCRASCGVCSGAGPYEQYGGAAGGRLGVESPFGNVPPPPIGTSSIGFCWH